MRTLPVGLRVTELERSLTSYRAVGHEVVGSVPETGLGCPDRVLRGVVSALRWRER